MDLSIIIVNYKTPTLVIDCLETVYGQTHGCRFEVIVVDNHSEDESRQRITGRFPQVTWIQLGNNSGFARGNNAGIRAATGRYILLLNGDTLIKEDALSATVALMDAHANVAACGVQLLNADGTYQMSGAHMKKGGLNTLLPIPYLGSWVRGLGRWIKTTVPSVSAVPDQLEVGWISGAFLCVRKSILEKSGLLDEDFFMYAEEIEWCARLGKQGPLYLFGKPQVIHLGGGTSSEVYNVQGWDNSRDLWSRKAKQIMVSSLLRVRKQFGVFWFFVILGAYTFGIPVFAIGLFFEKTFRGPRSRYTWPQWRGYARNTGAMWSYFFKMLTNKPYFYKVN
jgi:GT2 family glycosyltransferase